MKKGRKLESAGVGCSCGNPECLSARLEQARQKFIAEKKRAETSAEFKKLSPLEKFKRVYSLDFDGVVYSNHSQFHNRKRGEWNSRLDAIKKQALEGDPVALRELAHIARTATSKLAEVAEVDPEFVSLLAQFQVRWPVNAWISKRGFARVHNDLTRLKLEKWKPLLITMDEWKARNSPAKEWALHLFRLLFILSKHLPTPDVPEVHQQWILDVYYTEVPLYDRLQNDAPTYERVKSLPDLNEQTIERVWWPLARELFLKWTHNRPWEAPGLEKQYESARSKNGTPGIKRSDVLKHVGQAFVDMARQYAGLPSKRARSGKRVKQKRIRSRREKKLTSKSTQVAV